MAFVPRFLLFPAESAPDGRFLRQRRPNQGSADDLEAPHINVILNWFEELRERVPN